MSGAVTGTAQVIRGDARHLPLADNTVDLVVTSPPYLNLRSYQDAGAHYEGQIGSEQTPDEFLTNLLEVTAECVRVLKPTGSLFVNLGDSYRDKGLQLTPERYRIRCADELGLITRAVIVWAKPNGLPESVTDRVRRSHEDWAHFTLQPRYFSAVDEIREQYDTADRKGERRSYPAGSASSMSATGEHQAMTGPFAGLPLNPLGKLPGSVWTVPTEPLRVPDHLGIDHFAAFPTEWPKRIIAGWSPAGVCVACGEGRRPVVEPPGGSWHDHGADGQGHNQNGRERKQRYLERVANGQVRKMTGGYACACPEPTADTTPATVLDPFGGTGTTALVAKALGRHGITVDMSADYCRLAEWRTNDRDQLAKVLGVAKAEQQDANQAAFDFEVGA